MIDPFTAFAALKGATEVISKGIKTGKDLAKYVRCCKLNGQRQKQVYKLLLMRNQKV